MRVELRGVGKRFGRITALHDIDLLLPSGSRTALIGPNGSGKSTLVRMLMGMLTGDGEVRLDGLDPAVARAALQQRVAYVPQIAPRLWAPVREVVAAVARLRDIDRARIEALAARFELDMTAIGRRPFRALSGGMRQKVLAALALATDADLLLLDEPTASMDPPSRATFFALLDELPRQTTIVLSSHRVEELRRQVDDVVVLAEGRMTFCGAAADWLRASTEAIVEVACDGDTAPPWLRERGFVPSRSGWWTRTVPADQRARVVGEVVRGLNGAVVDVMARDLERLGGKALGREEEA